MKETASLQKQILQSKLRNCQKSLQDLRKKKEKINRAEEELLASAAKINLQLEKFGKKKDSNKSSKKEEVLKNSADQKSQDNKSTLTAEERSQLPDSLLKTDPPDGELRNLLRP